MKLSYNNHQKASEALIRLITFLVEKPTMSKELKVIKIYLKCNYEFIKYFYLNIHILILVQVYYSKQRKLFNF